MLVIFRTAFEIEILVVESNPTDTLLTKEAFKAAGLTSGLRSVTDGEDALMYVHRQVKYANVPIPDVIFLDLSQPRMSALEVLQVIKSTPELMHIPIVVLERQEPQQTSVELPPVTETALFLTVPVDSDALNRSARNLL